MKRPSFKKLFDNNRFVQIFSLVAAALCWLIVAMTQSYETTETIRNVPVKIDSQASALTSIGLHAIESDEIYVDIDVEGIRSVVGRLTPEDFSITTRLTDVTEAATYELTPISANPTPSDDYSIVSFSPKKVKVSFDRVGRMSFPVREQVNGLAIVPGYTKKDTFVTPDTVTIEGPSAELQKISRCAVTAELTSPLDRTYAGDFPIVLYGANGDVLDMDNMHLSMDRTEAQIMIQVLKIANLPLRIGFTNIPRGFPADELMSRTEISQSDVTIAGPTELVDKTNEIQLEYINIKSIAPENSAYTFDVPLPSPSDQFMRIDNVMTVAVDIDMTNLTTAVYNIPAINIINAPAGFDVTLLAQSLPDVRFVGEREIFSTMTADDIVAEIDLSEREVVSGSYPFPVKISVPGKGLVWAVGDHSVAIQVTEQ